jgi:hypothetical protein
VKHWADRFTGKYYELSPAAEASVRRHLAMLINGRLQGNETDLKSAADCVARFWSDEYYALVFPLTFGFCWNDGWLEGVATAWDSSDAEPSWRKRPFDGQRLPPILPLSDNSEVLIADYTLACTATCNVVLRSRGIADDRLHAMRLAMLVRPLWRELSELQVVLPQQVEQILTWLGASASASPPDGLPPDLLNAAQAGDQGLRSLQDQAHLVLGLVQRVKQYVFESSGLNEIRGASTLLDLVTDDFKSQVDDELGPEVVFRAAGSAIQFLAPSSADSNGQPWSDRIVQRFRAVTGTALVTAVSVPCPVGRLWSDFQSLMGDAYRQLECRRETMPPDPIRTLPFEERCSLCGRRAAEGWQYAPGGLPEPFCSVCCTKRKAGQVERRGKLERLLARLDLNDAERLGVEGQTASQYVASSFTSAEGEDDGLIPPRVRRSLLGVIYGDGNNFGAVPQKLNVLPLHLQWTHRVEKVTEAAAALAMGVATQRAAQLRGWAPGKEPKLNKLPFQVLALGGDDISLFSWGPPALYFAQQFTQLTDDEFQQGDREKLTSQPLSFSLGVLVCDEKAAVQRTVEFTEEQLLKWAKRASRNGQGKLGGNIALVLAMTAEQIPADLDHDRRSRYLLHSARQDLYLTIRPYLAGELAYLLDVLDRLGDEHLGRLQRLVSALVGQSPQAALLHAIYQWAREKRRAKKPDQTLAGIILNPTRRPDSLRHIGYPAARLEDRTPFGEKTANESIAGDVKSVGYCVLGDLMELSKILR